MTGVIFSMARKVTD